MQFSTFLLHALTYWAEILHLTLFWCTTDQVWVSSLCVNFWRCYASLWTQNIGNVQFSALFSNMLWRTTDQVQVSSLCVNFWRSYASLWTQNIRNVQFSALFSYMLWHIELKFCIWLCFDELQNKFKCCHFASIFERVMPLCELRK